MLEESSCILGVIENFDQVLAGVEDADDNDDNDGGEGYLFYTQVCDTMSAMSIADEGMGLGS